MHIDTPKLLITIIVITLLLLPIAIFTTGPLRIILSLPFVLFFPGYTLLSAILPRRDDLDGIKRVVLGFGLSIAVVCIIGLVLNYTPWGIRLYPIIIAITLFILVASGIAWYRERRLAPTQQFSIVLNIRSFKLAWLHNSNKVLSISLAVAIMAALGCFAFVIATPKQNEKFTEFYILNTEGKAENYPQHVALGEKIELIIGVVNHEYAPAAYRVEINIAGIPLEEINIATLAQDEKWEEAVSFIPQTLGEKQKVEFWLYKDGEAEPYYKAPLHLYIDVTKPS